MSESESGLKKIDVALLVCMIIASLALAAMVLYDGFFVKGVNIYRIGMMLIVVALTLAIAVDVIRRELSISKPK